MKSTDAPSKQAVPFGTNGPREAITATTPSGSNQASYDQGFPPITMTLKSAGGLPPKGQDMNQILFENASFDRYFAAGGGYTFDAAFSTAVGGYPSGARVQNSTRTGFWLNTVEDNNTNPENTTAAITGWIPVGSYGVTSISGLASSSVTLSTLQASKDRIVLSGTLTANINVVVPAWVKSWQVINNCVGAFTVTIKTPSGTGVAMSSSTTHYVVGDGVNIFEDLGSAAFASVGSAAGQVPTNSLLGTASTRNVGSGANQIPDMSFFASQRSGNGYFFLPNGLIFQWYTLPVTPAVSPNMRTTSAGWPYAFPNNVFACVASLSNVTTYLTTGQGFVSSSVTTSGFTMGSGYTPSNSTVTIMAIGN